jgi:hypothetical protein
VIERGPRSPARRKTLKKLALLLLVLVAFGIAGCGGDGEEGPRDGVEAPRETTGAPASLPPEFVKCMADRGYEIESSADIHSAPPKVVQACFESVHQGGGAP